MAALTSTTPLVAGAVTTSAAVTASDTISQAQLGSRGVYLEILNTGAGVDTITISDAGSTPAGNTLTGGTYTVAVTNATNKIFYINPAQANLSTGLVTVTHSQLTGTAYKLYTLG